jgi:hypothetical protein
VNSRPWTAIVCFPLCLALRAQDGQQPLGFVPVTPCRLVDTRRAGPFGGPALAGQSIRKFTPSDGGCGVPRSAMAYSLNLTVVPHEPLGYLTVWPAGLAQPTVSTLNSFDARIKANGAIVGAGGGGAFSVFVTDSTDLVLDINGYFTSSLDNSTFAFYPLRPCRVLDTRDREGPLSGPVFAAGETRALSLLSTRCSAPPTAQVYAVNFTAIPHEPLRYLTAWPHGRAQPLVSTLNSQTGTVVANSAILSTRSYGNLDVFVTNETDLVLDVVGYFAPAGQPGALWFFTVPPCRVADTRLDEGPFAAPIAGGASRAFLIAGRSCFIPAGAEAYYLNVTVVPVAGLRYLTVWPSQGSLPLSSTLNSLDGTVASNSALVAASPDGSIEVFASDLTDVVLDISGYFADQSGAAIPPPPSNQHSVRLQWNPSVSPNIVAYNLYRGNASGGPYTRINANPPIATVYVDKDVSAGQTYYYVTTAVNNQGFESGPSNEVVAVIRVLSAVPFKVAGTGAHSHARPPSCFLIGAVEDATPAVPATQSFLRSCGATGTVVPELYQLTLDNVPASVDSL